MYELKYVDNGTMLLMRVWLIGFVLIEMWHQLDELKVQIFMFCLLLFVIVLFVFCFVCYCFGLLLFLVVIVLFIIVLNCCRFVCYCF